MDNYVSVTKKVVKALNAIQTTKELVFSENNVICVQNSSVNKQFLNKRI